MTAQTPQRHWQSPKDELPPDAIILAVIARALIQTPDISVTAQDLTAIAAANGIVINTYLLVNALVERNILLPVITNTWGRGVKQKAQTSDIRYSDERWEINPRIKRQHPQATAMAYLDALTTIAKAAD